METDTAPVVTPVTNTTAIDHNEIETKVTPDEYGTASTPISRTGPEDDDGANAQSDD